ncbi:MAG: nickel pincer cofactor biosynthesis protein LarB [Bacillota bacterium]
MNEKQIKAMLEGVKAGEKTVDEALFELKKLPFEDLGYAKLDHHREIRNGYPEVIFSQGKTTTQVAEIFKRLLARNANVMATRASSEVFEAVKILTPNAQYNELARIVYVTGDQGVESPQGAQGASSRASGNYIAVVSAGTSDMPVAEEAALTAEILGNEVHRVYDVGVAGIHRLLANTDELMKANVVIVVAGMEGALASVVGGLVDKPVVAVPTSIGYGASFGGIAALLAMLNSCASGVGVVNIDNGFGAGYLAATINRLSTKE